MQKGLVERRKMWVNIWGIPRRLETFKEILPGHPEAKIQK